MVLMTDVLFTVPEVAKRLKITVWTVVLMLRAKAIRGTRIGKAWRVSAREMERLSRVGIPADWRERMRRTAKSPKVTRR